MQRRKQKQNFVVNKNKIKKIQQLSLDQMDNAGFQSEDEKVSQDILDSESEDPDHEVYTDDEVDCDHVVNYYKNKELIKQIEDASEIDFEMCVTKRQFINDINQFRFSFQQSIEEIQDSLTIIGRDTVKFANVNYDDQN